MESAARSPSADGRKFTAELSGAPRARHREKNRLRFAALFVIPAKEV
jgi:hypothetical protein